MTIDRRSVSGGPRRHVLAKAAMDELSYASDSTRERISITLEIANAITAVTFATSPLVASSYLKSRKHDLVALAICHVHSRSSNARGERHDGPLFRTAVPSIVPNPLHYPRVIYFSRLAELSLPVSSLSLPFPLFPPRPLDE